MPYHLFHDAEQKILLARFEPEVTEQELLVFHGTAGRVADELDPDIGIVDLTALTDIAVSLGTVREIARQRAVISDPEKPRYIVAPSTAVYGLVRMYQQLGEDVRPNLFVMHALEEVYAHAKLRPPKFVLLDLGTFSDVG